METRLGNYIHEYSVRNKLDEDIPVYSVTNSQGFCKDYFGKEVASKNKTTYKIVPKGYFAYNPSRINVGSVDWQRNEERVIVSPLYNVFYVDSEINHQYLFYFLKSDFALQNIKAVATGSVRDNLKFEMLKEFQIKLLPLEEQNEIVEKLDLITKIIEEYKAELYKYDELIKARFVEMFSDPEINSFDWPVCTLKELVSFEPQNGLYKPQSAYVQDGSGFPIVRIDAFYNGRITNFSALKRLECSESEVQRYLLQENDIVINRVNSIEYLGKCAHIKGLLEETVFESNMMRLHLDDTVMNAVFATKLLCSPYIYKQIMIRAKKAVNQASINQQDVLSFRMFVPPLELQEQFADFVQQVDKSKFICQSSFF